MKGEEEVSQDLPLLWPWLAWRELDKARRGCGRSGKGRGREEGWSGEKKGGQE